ncbi:hypothetical protein EPA93_00185 [Ktedonosporobacter rubrisoli]|uniref:Uncharacterized protein n=1 Tax=Ktedonosporobacter rubrisoli TaxID=2509675 RepID=A0A4P6JHK3_KTERU|nr:hypothetical protein [Ktedonosporobacter rubrisoli]QBD74495.1 hypothetical protein EPA93_00185 [Ktedonosporobacter rubrisoli]
MSHATVLDLPALDQPISSDEFELDVRISLTTHVQQIAATSAGNDLRISVRDTCDSCTSCSNTCYDSCINCWTTAVCA